jgi:hypothetical protein
MLKIMIIFNYKQITINKMATKVKITDIDKLEQIRSLKSQLGFLTKHLQWCKDNNRPGIDVHTKVIEDIKVEIKNLKN